MPLATRTELLEIVPELRAMAAQSKTTTVRETLNLLANRYAAMAAGLDQSDATGGLLNKKPPDIDLRSMPPAPSGCSNALACCVRELASWIGSRSLGMQEAESGPIRQSYKDHVVVPTAATGKFSGG